MPIKAQRAATCFAEKIGKALDQLGGARMSAIAVFWLNPLLVGSYRMSDINSQIFPKKLLKIALKYFEAVFIFSTSPRDLNHCR
jgi:hypothetical protein